MAETISCPSCSSQLQVPDSYIGQVVQCPECQHTFTATTTSMSSEPMPSKPGSSTPPRDDDEPRKKPRYDDDDDYDRRRRDRDRERDRGRDDDLDVRRRGRGYGGGSGYGGGDIPTYMAQAIMVTLCCCWPLGIVAIIQAARVNSALGRGDYDAARSASEDAKKWCWIAFILGLIAHGLYVLFNIMNEGRNF
jgi:predicted Zn finger-like uncharacterized protein